MKRERIPPEVFAVARHLNDADRQLIEACRDESLTYAEIARRLGLDRQAVARRIGVLLARLSDPLAIAAGKVLDGPELDETAARVIRLHFIDGWSIREIASLTGLAKWAVRRHCDGFRYACRVFVRTDAIRVGA